MSGGLTPESGSIGARDAAAARCGAVLAPSPSDVCPGVDSMRNRQVGVTAIGWLFLLTPVAIVVYAGIRLAPVYLNYMKVAKAMDQVGNELKAGGVSAQSIRATID